jgi:hypothetical protein
LKGVSANAETTINTEINGVKNISVNWHISAFAEMKMMPFRAG